MKVTGHQLKESLELANMQANNLQEQFSVSLKAFKDEKDKPEKQPIAIAEKLESVYRQIAKLQEAQSYYNLQVKVEVGPDKLSLAEVVKLISNANAYSRMWNTAASQTYQQVSPYGRTRGARDVREKDSEYAEPTIGANAMLEQAAKARQFAIRLRSALGKGNSQEVDIPSLKEEIVKVEVKS